jgi:hypothetical protein
MVDSNLNDAVPAVRANRHYPPRYVFAKNWPAEQIKKPQRLAATAVHHREDGWRKLKSGQATF